MTVTATSATNPLTSTAAAAAATSGQLQGTQSEFLTLFMAQLQNQDPLNPQNGSDMVAQLAQFSSVEQQTETNQQLQALTAAQTSTSSAQLSSLVGRDCNVNTGDFTIDSSGTGVPPVDVSATGAMKGASLVITDVNGKTVRTLPIPDGSTAAAIQWDGKDAAGQTVPPGSYHMAVAPGSTVSTINANWHGNVDAVELTSNGPRLRMGELLFSPGDVTTIGTTDTQPTTIAGAHP